MRIEWDKAGSNLPLDDLSKSLVREIAGYFLVTGTGLPDREKRVELGKDRRLLDALVQRGVLMNIANKYYPRFTALYYLSPDQRESCEEATTWVLRAYRSLYKDRGPQTIPLVEISDQINRLAPSPVGVHAARIGMQFARDFPNYFGNFDNTSDIPASAASVGENILDFEDLGQAWQEESDRRRVVMAGNAPLPAAKAGDSVDVSKRTEVLSGKSRRVFVVHGRDQRLRTGIFMFLRAVGLEPIEWIKAMDLTGTASPYIGEILDAAFRYAQAVVVVLSPDDEARLRKDLIQPDDLLHEKELTGQARPNVLFEAGMAFASHPTQTVLVQLGQVRPFSDVAGRHIVKMDNSPQKRQELALKLKTAGCSVDMEGTDWQTFGDLTPSPERIATPSEANRTLPDDGKPVPGVSKLSSSNRVVIAPVSRTTSDKEYTLEKVDELGVVIRLANGVNVRIPKTDYIESWDDWLAKPKLLLTRKYFQGYFPGHEAAGEYFLPR